MRHFHYALAGFCAGVVVTIFALITFEQDRISFGRKPIISGMPLQLQGYAKAVEENIKQSLDVLGQSLDPPNFSISNKDAMVVITTQDQILSLKDQMSCFNGSISHACSNVLLWQATLGVYVAHYNTKHFKARLDVAYDITEKREKGRVIEILVGGWTGKFAKKFPWNLW